MGRACLQEVNHAIEFAEMRCAVCRRQLRFLFLDSADCITTIIAEYAVETVSFSVQAYVTLI